MKKIRPTRVVGGSFFILCVCVCQFEIRRGGHSADADRVLERSLHGVPVRPHLHGGRHRRRRSAAPAQGVGQRLRRPSRPARADPLLARLSQSLRIQFTRINLYEFFLPSVAG